MEIYKPPLRPANTLIDTFINVAGELALNNSPYRVDIYDISDYTELILTGDTVSGYYANYAFFSDADLQNLVSIGLANAGSISIDEVINVNANYLAISYKSWQATPLAPYENFKTVELSNIAGYWKPDYGYLGFSADITASEACSIDLDNYNIYAETIIKEKLTGEHISAFQHKVANNENTLLAACNFPQILSFPTDITTESQKFYSYIPITAFDSELKKFYGKQIVISFRIWIKTPIVGEVALKTESFNFEHTVNGETHYLNRDSYTSNGWRGESLFFNNADTATWENAALGEPNLRADSIFSQMITAKSLNKNLFFFSPNFLPKNYNLNDTLWFLHLTNESFSNTVNAFQSPLRTDFAQTWEGDYIPQSDLGWTGSRINSANEYTSTVAVYQHLDCNAVPYFIDFTSTQIETIFKAESLSSLQNKSDMDITKQEFSEMAAEFLGCTGRQKIFVETEVKKFQHDDANNALTIELTPNEKQMVFVKRINVHIAKTGSEYSMKVIQDENAVNTILKVVPDGIEGSDQAGGYFADKIEIKGNVSGQIIMYKAFVN